MKLIKKRMFSSFILLLFLTVSFTTSVYAAETADGSITLQLEDMGTRKGNVSFSVYQVASLADDGINYWTLDNRLSVDVDFEEMTTAKQSQAVAKKIADVIEKSNISKISLVTDSSGKAAVKGLIPGLYLIVQNNESEYGTVAPFLAEIPQKQDEKWSYDAVVSPKGEVPKATPTITPTTTPPVTVTVTPRPTNSNTTTRATTTKTGDVNNIGLSIALLAASGVLSVILILKKKKTSSN